MNNEKSKKIEEILSSLDQTPRAAAPDFFYTRLKARMEKGLDPLPVKNWAIRPVYAFATLVLVIVINAFVILQRSNTNTEVVTDNNESVQSIAAEYSLNDNYMNYEISQ